MKTTLFGLAAIVFIGAVGWRIGGTLSTDALGMAVGMLFGIMAGIPTALIMLADRRREVERKPPQITHNHVWLLPEQRTPRERFKEIEQRHSR